MIDDYIGWMLQVEDKANKLSRLIIIIVIISIIIITYPSYK